MILTVCANPSVDSFWSIKEIQKGTTNRSREESYFPGGKGIHTAFALNELGLEVATLGVWGGQTGKWLQKECRRKDITTIGPEVDEWNRICITLNTDSDWNETELLGSGPVVNNQTAERFLSAYKKWINRKNTEAILISGSVPPGFKVDLYRRLVDEAKKHSTRTFVDASGPLLEQTLKVQPYGLHLNQKEGMKLSGKKKPVDIARWFGDRCTLAAITAGAEGLYLAFKKKIYHAYHTIDNGKIINTIGAGDCLLAGLSMATLKDDNPENWSRFATACGSANCIHPELGMFKAEDVEQIINQVSLKIL